MQYLFAFTTLWGMFTPMVIAWAGKDFITAITTQVFHYTHCIPLYLTLPHCLVLPCAGQLQLYMPSICACVLAVEFEHWMGARPGEHT